MIDFNFINYLGLSKHIIIYIIDIAVVLVAIVVIYKKKVSHQQKKSSISLKKNNNENNDAKSHIVITSQDIRAIAGDDVMVTQLDLARAYIELGKKKLAKQILDHVIKHGNSHQQQSARQLMAGF